MDYAYFLIGGGVDYASGPYNVSFPPGDTSVSFDISITYDQIEDNENFTLSISPHLPPLITHGDITEAIVIIFNKNIDRKSIAKCCSYWYVMPVATHVTSHINMHHIAGKVVIIHKLYPHR